MADLVFVLVAAMVMFIIILADNAKRAKKMASGISKLIREIESGEVKYKPELIARLKKL